MLSKYISGIIQSESVVKDLSDLFGGMARDAAEKLKGRKRRLEQMEEDAMKSPEDKAAEAYEAGKAAIEAKKKKK